MATRVNLPDKLFFKIGEVTRIAGVKQHVLRYWESEFSSIRPQKSKTNQRLYRRSDVLAVLAIKNLLYDKKFTIEGAKQHLKKDGIESSVPPEDPAEIAKAAKREVLDEMKLEVARAKGDLRQYYEKQLLQVRSSLTEFIKKIDDDQNESKNQDE